MGSVVASFIMMAVLCIVCSLHRLVLTSERNLMRMIPQLVIMKVVCKTLG